MSQATQIPPHLLIVEDDEETCNVILDVLTEEGYSVACAASLDEALARMNHQVFDLILADVVGWTTHAPLQAVERLRDQAQPTPVSLLTCWDLTEETVTAKGFARLLKKPFDLSELLTLVAELVARPLAPEQECQAEVARRYCEAVDAHDWQACATLCREDVRYYPTPNSLFDRHREVIGRAGLLEQLTHNAVVAPDFHYLSYSFYSRPDGIAVRYLATIGALKRREQLAGSILFQVEGEQIVQIGYRLDADHLRTWTHVQQKQRQGKQGA